MQLTVEQIAQVAHEADRAYSAAVLADYSQPVWVDATQESRDLQISATRSICEEPTITPAKLHEDWCSVMQMSGWKCGPLDITNRVHPSLMPYDELPEHDQARLRMFDGIVRGLLGLAKQD